MKKSIHKLTELVEEAKSRTFLWIVFVSCLAYLLSMTSNSLWLNIPVVASSLIFIRYLSFELEIRKRVQALDIPLHLSHLLKHQLSPDDLMLFSPSLSLCWRRKIDSPVIEEAVDGFTRRIVQEFVTNLWYSALSPDQDVPEQIRLLVNDIFGEFGQRVKRINLINLLTRDIIDLIGNHLELFRQMRSSIKRFETLSSDEREKALKLALAKGNQLHPALSSSDCECKVLQQLMGGMVAIVLRPQDAQCLLMRGLARELLACAVMRPIMNFASPGFVNKSIAKATITARARSELKGHGSPSKLPHLGTLAVGSSRGKCGDGGQVLDTASDQRSKALAPENIGQIFRKRDSSAKKSPRLASTQTAELQSRLVEKQDTRPVAKDVSVKRGVTPKASHVGDSSKFTASEASTNLKDLRRPFEHSKVEKRVDTFTSSQIHGDTSFQRKEGVGTGEISKGVQPLECLERPVSDTTQATGLRHRCAGSSTTGPETWQKPIHTTSSQVSPLDYWDSPGMQFSMGGGDLDHVSGWLPESAGANAQSGAMYSATKLNCWVVGAHLEKAASKTFAVYSIAVTDTDNNTWFVERRFRNFEQLHRKLRDLPQYNLQLPPKRFLASSLDDTFVRDRCILLDKYLKDLLSIPSIAELHEVWDFLSISSKNYAYAKSPSVMKTLAVNVDDAVDDMFRQLKGVSDGLLRRVGGPSTDSDEGSRVFLGDVPKQTPALNEMPSSSALQIERDKLDSYSDEELIGPCSSVEDSAYLIDNWPSDNELHNTTLNGVVPQRIPGHIKTAQWLDKRLERGGSDAFSVDESTTGSEVHEEDFAVPPEWTPPKLTEPLLNLVVNIFQLQDTGWIRQQGFWIAKQILQLGMGDAVDEWLVTQIQKLRQEEIVAGAIKSLQEVLWPGGVFVTKAQKGDNSTPGTAHKTMKQVSQKSLDQSAYLESQLESARCARVVHDVLLEGAPLPLVRFVGKQQYVKCVKDLFYFLQSAVFVKQLVFSVLETLFTAVFPEMTALILEIHHQGAS